MRNSVAVKVSAVLLTGAMLFGGAAGMTRTYAAEKGAAADKAITVVAKADYKFKANSGDLAFSKHPNIKKYFNKALDGLVDADYEPYMYLGSKKVKGGKNYYVLCRVTPVYPDAEPEFCVVTVNKSNKGKITLGDTGTISVDAEEKSEKSGDNGVQIPDPFENFTDKSAAEKAAGFEISLPEAKKGYETVIYRLDASTKMLEAVYSDKNLNENGSVEAYRIRKALGSDDISGDYNIYNETKNIKVNGNDVTLKGNDGKIFVATWTANGYTYAVDIEMGGLGMSADEVETMVIAIK